MIWTQKTANFVQLDLITTPLHVQLFYKSLGILLGGFNCTPCCNLKHLVLIRFSGPNDFQFIRGGFSIITISKNLQSNCSIIIDIL
jgi:hypothetical protein